MGNIRPYGMPKGCNHVGIYLFETISLQDDLGKPEGISHHCYHSERHNTLPFIQEAPNASRRGQRVSKYRPSPYRPTSPCKYRI